MGNVLAITSGQFNNKDINLEVVLDDNRHPIELFINDNDSLVGNIYVGRIDKIINKIGAVFVKISKDTNGYLPLKELDKAIVVKKNSASADLVQGDEIVVSVIRDKIKTKELALSTTVSFQSEYFVVDSSIDRIGVSKKIESEQSKLIRELIDKKITNITEDSSANYIEGSCDVTKDLASANIRYNVIARTIASKATIQELEDDLQGLLVRYNKFCRDIIHASLYSVQYTSEPHYIDVLKRYEVGDFQKVTTDSINIYNELIQTIEKYPSLAAWRDIIELYNDDSYSMWKLYSIDNMLSNISNPVVNCKSGASIVIEQTEALTVIDVNSSKNINSSRNKSSEDFIYEINLDAAMTIAREIKLRNVSGIIVIDFINMYDDSNKSSLLNALRRECMSDMNFVKVYDYTALGLVEMTRSKSGPSYMNIFK